MLDPLTIVKLEGYHKFWQPFENNEISSLIFGIFSTLQFCSVSFILTLKSFQNKPKISRKEKKWNVLLD